MVGSSSRLGTKGRFFRNLWQIANLIHSQCRLAWGTHVNTWRGAWEVVSHDPRPNLGLIIDSFNAMAREYADPYSASGLQRGPVQSAAFLKRHLADLLATVPGEKIYLFQIADAGLPAPSSPASTPPSLESGIPRLQPWSRNCRLFPLETERGAFLPVPQYAATVLRTGYSGDLSLEVFNASLHEQGSQVPSEHARRGYVALEKLDATLAGKSLGFCLPERGTDSQAPADKEKRDDVHASSAHDLLTAKLHSALHNRSASPQQPTAIVQH